MSLNQPTIVTNFGPLDERFSSLQAAIVHFMASGRRCGFRTVLCNRAVVSLSGLGCEDPAAPCGEALSSTDRVLLEQLVPDLGRSWLEYPAGAWERFERLYAAANVASPAARPSLLVDMRNLHAAELTVASIPVARMSEPLSVHRCPPCPNSSNNC